MSHSQLVFSQRRSIAPTTCKWRQLTTLLFGANYHIIYPYFNGDWLVDDDEVGIYRDNLLSDIDILLDSLCVQYGDSLRVIISDQLLNKTGSHLLTLNHIDHSDPEGGEWFEWTNYGEAFVGRLNSSIHLYFKKIPATIYVYVSAK